MTLTKNLIIKKAKAITIANKAKLMNAKSSETLKKGDMKENKPDKNVLKLLNSVLYSSIPINGKLIGKVSTIALTIKVIIDKKKSPIIVLF